jgi:hypothetical protein
MRYWFALFLLILWPIAGFSEETPPEAASNVGTYYRDVTAPPKGFARVYILPKLTETLFGDREHDAKIYLGPDSDHAVFAGNVEPGQFLAFDIEQGRTLYLRAASYGEAILHFVDNGPVFIRPFVGVAAKPEPSGWDDGDAKRLIEGQDQTRIGFDRLEPFSASNIIQGRSLAGLSTAALAFVSQKIGDRPIKAAAPPPQTTVKPAQTDVQKSIQAIPSGTNANTAESDLVALKRFYDNGLITKDEYDFKRREVLHKMQ